ncbi:anti-phage deoxyguanosine triphosphatase [Bradyrhizobium acaciae]|uniref:anti-phage deoxyguanosine triphosphatase n=1 Tax=Bradyrhizobium acaciae TaxID=2683706 RepID=UPI001E33F749|nr:anti-phage deoxyguanosine triphosphatase [Bradyrhizobium acaciae]MCC8981954.1 dGTPase [Bradyrhizobium acaciae]
MSWLERREGWLQQTEDARGDGDIDYARVIHSASFRRLQGKTQILNLGDSDFYRTRLTHSLEVAQIAGGIAKQLAKSFSDHPATAELPDRSLIQAVGCTHDLGHPPFGHGGEIALNYCMRDCDGRKPGGFEGNGQTLRILSRLENFSKDAGANLSRRSLLGVLKYPVAYSNACNAALIPSLVNGPTTLKIIDTESSKPPKCYMDSEADVVAWILKPLSREDRDAFQEFELKNGKHNKPKHKSLDCSIMDAADDIAYGVHDLEDAIALKLINETQFRDIVSEERSSSFLDALKAKYPRESANDVYGKMAESLFGGSSSRKHFVSRLVHHFITAMEYVEHEQFAEPLIRYRANMKEHQRKFLDALKELITTHVIKSPGVQHLEFKGQGMVVAVFEALQSDPARLLPSDALARFEKSAGDLRTICDFVAGMTDSYLLKTYERLFAPRMGSVFDKL